MQYLLFLPQAAIAFGKTVISDADSLQIAEQVEGRVRMRLKSKYQLPLKLTDTDAQKALASIHCIPD